VDFIAVIYLVAACNVHTIKSRWTRAVSTIYLIAVGCAAFLYSPWMIISDGDQAPYIAYKWIWNVQPIFLLRTVSLRKDGITPSSAKNCLD